MRLGAQLSLSGERVPLGWKAEELFFHQRRALAQNKGRAGFWPSSLSPGPTGPRHGALGLVLACVSHIDRLPEDPQGTGLIAQLQASSERPFPQARGGRLVHI